MKLNKVGFVLSPMARLNWQIDILLFILYTFGYLVDI